MRLGHAVNIADGRPSGKVRLIQHTRIYLSRPTNFVHVMPLLTIAPIGNNTVYLIRGVRISAHKKFVFDTLPFKLCTLPSNYAFVDDTEIPYLPRHAISYNPPHDMQWTPAHA